MRQYSDFGRGLLLLSLVCARWGLEGPSLMNDSERDAATKLPTIRCARKESSFDEPTCKPSHSENAAMSKLRRRIDRFAIIAAILEVMARSRLRTSHSFI